MIWFQYLVMTYISNTNKHKLQQVISDQTLIHLQHSKSRLLSSVSICLKIFIWTLNWSMGIDDVGSSFFNYLLSTGESYGPTAQHMQDFPIFFIQLNYVHKNKVLPPYIKIPCYKVAQHWEFHFLFLNAAILHSYIFGNSCFLSVEITFNTRHPSIIFVGLCLFVSIGMHLGIF